MRTDIAERKDEILEWVSTDMTLTEMSSRLNCRSVTTNSWLKKLDIEYKGNQGGRGGQDAGYVPALEYMKRDTCKPYVLKHKFLREGIKEHKCEQCGIEEWNGKPAPIEMDHIDGNRWNNDISNLKFLCCNCHAQTETYCRQNK